MRENEVMEQLAALGTEQTRKTYRRHGATGEVLGVLYSELRKLQKRYGTDQQLAEALWATGIHDARVLATLVADPAAMTDAKLEEWVGQVDNYPLGDAVAELAAKAPNAVDRMKAWIASGKEWVTAAGWQVVTILASRGNGELDDASYSDYLDQIERTIHSSPNRVRHSMNGALIAIGLRNPELQAKALASAERIGKVVVDHGQTNCKTPDAISYIRRAVLRRSDKNNEKTVTANEEPEMTETMNQSSTSKRSNTESAAPKTSTKRTAAAKPAAKKASKRAGAKKAGKKAAKRAAAKPAANKKASKRAAAKPAAGKKASKRGAAKPAAGKKASKRGAAKPAAGKKASKRAGANGAAPKKASKRAASKGTSRKQAAPTTATPPAAT